MAGFLKRLLGWETERPRMHGTAQLLEVPGSAASAQPPADAFDSWPARASVRAFASACSKLRPVVSGSANHAVRRALEWRPNALQTTSQFLAQTATILKLCTSCLILPVRDRAGAVCGFWPLIPASARLYLVGSVPWVDALAPDGSRVTCQVAECGVLRTDQFRSATWGDGNGPLAPVVGQAMATVESVTGAIRDSAQILYIAKANGIVADDDLKATRDRFARDMLSTDGNGTSLAVYDQKLVDLERVEPRNYAASSEQMQLVLSQVYGYFGTNEDILQSKWDEKTWTAFYEGQVEPFAVQLSQVLTCMTFTEGERARGNRIEFRSDRLQYATTAALTNLISNMVDRGVMSIERARELLGDDTGGTFVIRGEYVGLDSVGRPDASPQGDPAPEGGGGEGGEDAQQGGA